MVNSYFGERKGREEGWGGIYSFRVPHQLALRACSQLHVLSDPSVNKEQQFLPHRL